MLCFTETHLDNQVTDNHLLSECLNYTWHRRDLTAHSGGVIVYVSNGVFCRRRPDLELPPVKSIWLEIEYKTTCFLLCAMYRPPNARVSLWDDFNISIERAFDVNPNIIIMGDLNENLLNINNIKSTLPPFEAKLYHR